MTSQERLAKFLNSRKNQVLSMYDITTNTGIKKSTVGVYMSAYVRNFPALISATDRGTSKALYTVHGDLPENIGVYTHTRKPKVKKTVRQKPRRRCPRCHKLSNRFSNGVCKPCYNKEYHRKHRTKEDVVQHGPGVVTEIRKGIVERIIEPLSDEILAGNVEINARLDSIEKKLDELVRLWQ